MKIYFSTPLEMTARMVHFELVEKGALPLLSKIVILYIKFKQAPILMQLKNEKNISFHLN
jgi:hypothetical protein